MGLPYQQVFSRGASPFLRWSLSPFLLFFAVVFTFPLLESAGTHHMAGMIGFSLLVLVCLAGLLALWGIPFVGRIVTGIISLAYGWYVVDQCFIRFDGTWDMLKSKSSVSPIHAIMGFLVFGFPCLVYTITGRFPLGRKPEKENQEDIDPDA